MDIAWDEPFAAIDGPYIAENLNEADMAAAVDVNIREAVDFQSLSVWLKGIQGNNGGDDEQARASHQPFFRIP